MQNGLPAMPGDCAHPLNVLYILLADKLGLGDGLAGEYLPRLPVCGSIHSAKRSLPCRRTSGARSFSLLCSRVQR